MPLTPGTRLGPYEITAPLGAGGMGEVYRARDTRLGRDVAIKVLPHNLSANEEVRARFEREAKAVSSLNHPNICTLFDIGRAPGEAGSDGTDFLVMELIEGETLGARLQRGPLPAPELLKIGIEVADALDRAHRQGLVHRDLKPGNVMLTRSGAKLLDFGLARVTGLSASNSELSTSPTVTRALTTEGSIVGTFQYMSPEVLEGREADARSDLWALGAMLYEMATGRRAFEGKSQASLIGSIMNSQPAAISTVTPMAPPPLERVVEACLAKDPDQRIQTAHDVKLQLQWIAQGGSQAGVPAPVAARRRGRERLAWSVAAVAIVLAGALGFMSWRSAARPLDEMRFELRVPDQLTPGGPLRVSPDGRAVACNATDSSGVLQLWIRTFDNPDFRPLPGTQGSQRPCWSPDSRYLAFFSEGKLKKILISGGRPETICEAPGGYDCSWGSGNLIAFDGDASHPTVRAVSAGGGDPRVIAAPDSVHHNVSCNWPEFLPDGKHFLFIAQGIQDDQSHLCIGEVGSARRAVVMTGSSRVEYVKPGYLLFEREGALMAQRMNAATGKLGGEPHTLADRIGVARANGMPYFSASQNGVLAMSQASSSLRRVAWVDRTGRAQGEIGTPNSNTNIALSPDGRYLATENLDASGQSNDIWVRDLQRDISSRFTVDPGNDIWPTWSADSKSLYWTSNRTSHFLIYRRDLQGVSQDSVFYTGTNDVGPIDASRDGNYLACMQSDGSGGWDVYAVPTHGERKPIPIAQSRFNEMRARFSPDGHWVSYDSDQSGRGEVYVQSFPVAGAPIQISNQGGYDARWSADGRQLYYRNPQFEILAVDVKLGERFEATAPARLFTSPLNASGLQVSRWLPSADAQKFLFSAPVRAELSAPMVVFNWSAALERK